MNIHKGVKKIKEKMYNLNKRIEETVEKPEVVKENDT